MQKYILMLYLTLDGVATNVWYQRCRYFTTSVILCKIFWHLQQFIVTFGIKAASYVTLFVSRLLANLLLKRFQAGATTNTVSHLVSKVQLQVSQPLLKRFIYTTFWLLLLTYLDVWYQRFRQVLVSQPLSDFSLKRLWLLLLTHGDVWYQRFVYFADTSAISSFWYKTF